MSNKVTQAPDHLAASVDLSNDTTNVYNSPALLHGVHVHTALSAQACPIEDGGGGTVLFNIPASTAGGTWLEAGSMRFGTGIFVNPDNSAAGRITVVYTPDLEGLAGSGAGLP